MADDDNSAWGGGCAALIGLAVCIGAIQEHGLWGGLGQAFIWFLVVFLVPAMLSEPTGRVVLGVIVLIAALIGAPYAGCRWHAAAKQELPEAEQAQQVQRTQLARTRKQANDAKAEADALAGHVRELEGALWQVPEPVERAPSATAFWPFETEAHEDGYLLDQQSRIPLRAFARHHEVPLHTSPDLKTEHRTEAIMPMWVPHHVFESRGEALLIGQAADTPAEDRRWVRADGCFCWNTRLCLNFEQPVEVYASLEDCRRQEAPGESYSYPFPTTGEDGMVAAPVVVRSGELPEQRVFPGPPLPSLPLLWRQDEIYCFMRYEGYEHGYQPCWLRWDRREDDRVQGRVRTTAEELAAYLKALRAALAASPDTRSAPALKLAVYDLGQSYLTQAPLAGEREIVAARTDGIPWRDGFLADPMPLPLQPKAMRERLDRLWYAGGRSSWARNEHRYLLIDDFP